ncbi:uncharacterized protein Z520_03730 [Fonsecaea multimorphosa CBS 102226]|uniref:Uncharacterized protein n=1 Tax=Fonsecaea multimorphosa CBS 102226 TaxID=1442371 RepID=A0A0D2KWA1_9EURO|nr:uncharacterized protein Z520_03730 [Fonsecaea multimorphosa CBS 102226]KIY01064.1 hypothetical protein Z520_03730 [Fonsecaea multimorphosa CBS 102226]
MGIPDQVVVLLCILGAAASVTVGFAFQRLFGRPDSDDGNFNHKQPEQDAYMREECHDGLWGYQAAASPPSSGDMRNGSVGTNHEDSAVKMLASPRLPSEVGAFQKKEDKEWISETMLRWDGRHLAWTGACEVLVVMQYNAKQ